MMYNYSAVAGGEEAAAGEKHRTRIPVSCKGYAEYRWQKRERCVRTSWPGSDRKEVTYHETPYVQP